MPSLGLGLGFARGSSFNPSSLFTSGSRGFFYDFSDYSTQFTDTAGTTAITGVGQSLGLVLDKSAGLAQGPELITNGNLSAGLAGWTQVLGTTSVVGGRLRVARSGGAQGRASSAAMTCVVGRAYRVAFDAFLGTVSTVDWYVSISATSSTGNIYAGSSLSSGAASFVFIATQTTHWLHLQCSIGVDGDYTEFDNISVRELPGNHATQATAGSRPLTTTIGTGFRGIQFDGVDDFLQTAAIDFAGAESLGPELVTNGAFAADASWDKGTGWTISGGVATKVAGTASNLGQTVSPSLTAGRTYRVTFSVTVTAGSVDFLFTGGTTTFAATGITTTQTVNVVTSALGANNYFVFVANAAFAGTIDNISVREVLIPADEVTVVAGVRKLSDAAQGIVVELTANAGTIPNSFNIQAPGPATSYRIVSGGSLTAGAVFDATGLAAPRTDVLTGLANISGATASLRANGVQVAGGSAAQGTGNYANDIVFIGRRGGTTAPFNGVLTFLCVINRTLTADDLAALEAYANSRTGAY